MSKKAGSIFGPLPPPAPWELQPEMARFHNMVAAPRLNQKLVWIWVGGASLFAAGSLWVLQKFMGKMIYSRKFVNVNAAPMPPTMSKEWKELEAKQWESQNVGTLHRHRKGQKVTYHIPESPIEQYKRKSQQRELSPEERERVRKVFGI